MSADSAATMPHNSVPHTQTLDSVPFKIGHVLPSGAFVLYGVHSSPDLSHSMLFFFFSNRNISFWMCSLHNSLVTGGPARPVSKTRAKNGFVFHMTTSKIHVAPALVCVCVTPLASKRYVAPNLVFETFFWFVLFFLQHFFFFLQHHFVLFCFLRSFRQYAGCCSLRPKWFP